MADPRVQAVFERIQLCNRHVDLSLPHEGDHAIYWYNLHMVLVHTERFREVCEERIAARRAMIVGVCEKQRYLLSRAGIVSDHVHLTLGGVPNQSPGEIAVRFMNNLAYREEMKRVLSSGIMWGRLASMISGPFRERSVQSSAPLGQAQRGREGVRGSPVVANPPLRWGKPSGGVYSLKRTGKEFPNGERLPRRTAGIDRRTDPSGLRVRTCGRVPAVEGCR